MAKQINKADLNVTKKERKTFAQIERPVRTTDVEEFRSKICAVDVEGVRYMLEIWGEVLLVAFDSVSPTALHLAAERGNSVIMQMILDYLPEWKKKITLNSRDNEDDTPLHKAVCKGHVENIQFLLANNVDLEKGNRQVATALFCAVTQRDFNIARLLLAKGASINRQTRNGESVLHFAVVNGNAYYVEEILKYGARIDLKNGDGETALHCAVRMGKLDLVQILLTYGADVNQANRENQTSLHLAIQYHNGNVIEILLDRGAKIDFEVLCFAASFGRANILDDLMRRTQLKLNDEEWAQLTLKKDDWIRNVISANATRMLRKKSSK